MGGLNPLLVFAFIGFVLSGCAYEYREQAYLGPRPLNPTQPHPTIPQPIIEKGVGALNREVKASLRMAFSKAIDAPESYRIRNHTVYRFEQKVRYRIEIAGSDGSIWRAFVEKPEEAESTAENYRVTQITKTVEPVAIFKPYASARKKGEVEETVEAPE